MSIAQGGLLAIEQARATFNDQYRRQAQQADLKIRREQQDNVNAQQAVIDRKDEARTLVGNINAHFGEMGKSWNKTDGLRLLKEKPELAIGMLNDAPSKKYREFTNEKGEIVGSKLVRLQENEDGSLTPMIQRMDTGAIVPMTVNRSADPKDPVAKLSPQAVEKTLNARYQAAVTDGGLENTSSFLSTGQAITANRARAKSLDLAAEKIKDRDQLSQFYNQIHEIDIEEDGATEALLGIYKSLGGDPEALQAEGQARADELANEGEPYPDGSLAARLQDEGINQEKWNTFTPEQQDLIVGRLNTGQKIGKFWDQTGGRVAAGAQDFVDNKGKRIRDVVDAVIKSPVGRFFGVTNVDDFRNEPPVYNEATGENEAEIDRQRTPITRQRVEDSFNPPTSSRSPSGKIPRGTTTVDPRDPVITPPPFELTAENVRDAILSETAEPTDEQITGIDKFLKARGIDNDAELARAIKAGEINQQEGLMLGWVLGATAKGDTNVKAGIAQNIENLIVRDDQDVGTLQAAQLESARAQGAAATRSAQIEHQELQRKLLEYDHEAIGPMQEFGEAALTKVYKQLDLVDEDGEWTDNDFDGDEDDAKIIGREITKFIPRLKTARGPESGSAGMQYLNPMLSFYLQSLANADEGGLFSGETYKDFFRLDPDGTTDFDLENVRVGKMKDGVPVSIVYVDQAGVRSQAVDIKRLQKDQKVLARLLATAAVANKQKQDNNSQPK
jgi:hypothetical protein